MNTFMTTQFLYTLDAWMFHNQKPNQYISTAHKKNTFDNCQARSRIFFQCNSHNKATIFIFTNKILPELFKEQKNISSEILKCIFEVTECQSPFRNNLDFKMVRFNISMVWEYGNSGTLLPLQSAFP